MRKILFFLFLCIAGYINAQTVILEREVKDFSADSLLTGKMISGKKFSTPGIAGFSFPLSQSDIALNAISSIGLYYGTSYKFKFTRVFNAGFTASYYYRNFNLEQTNEKTFPDSLNNNKECIRFHAVDLGAFIRIVYAQSLKGNGKFIDLGMNAQYIFGNNHTTWNDGPDGTILKLKERNLPYVNKFQYYAMAQAGFSFFTLQFTYRFSDLFDTSYGYPELPNMFLGMQFVLGK